MADVLLCTADSRQTAASETWWIFMFLYYFNPRQRREVCRRAGINIIRMTLNCPLCYCSFVFLLSTFSAVRCHFISTNFSCLFNFLYRSCLRTLMVQTRYSEKNVYFPSNVYVLVTILFPVHLQHMNSFFCLLENKFLITSLKTVVNVAHLLWDIFRIWRKHNLIFMRSKGQIKISRLLYYKTSIKLIKS